MLAAISNLYELFFYTVALAAQLFSVLVAISAFKNSGRYRYPWIIMSTVLGAMLLRRVIALNTIEHHNSAELLESSITMATSIGMAVAIYGLKNIFLELKNQKILLESLVQTDPLTGALNRSGIMTHLEQEFLRAERSLKPLSVFMIDIDHFKLINDQFGHLIGDQVLQNLIVFFQRSLREIDFIGRYGGEEFLAILPNTKVEEALIAAERIRQNVEGAICAYVNKNPIKITVSIGVAIYEPQNHTHKVAQPRPTEYIRRSDIAMYKAKNSGRNRVVVWSVNDPIHKENIL